MKGIRTVIGKSMLGSAVSSFENIIKRIEDGIVHLKADRDSHVDTIQDSERQIVEIEEHITKADRILGKVKSIIE